MSRAIEAGLIAAPVTLSDSDLEARLTLREGRMILELFHKPTGPYVACRVPERGPL